MNKKIFTLLAGALLLLGAAFTANAQVVASSGVNTFGVTQSLRLGAAAKNLKGNNMHKYYHLKVDSITNLYTPSIMALMGEVAGSKPSAGYAVSDSLVLYMYQSPTHKDSMYLYTDALGKSKFGTNITGSAASLWCVTVASDDQGANNIYDFVNKAWDQMMEVDYFDYSLNDTAFVPGGASGWQFSEKFETGLYTRPLYTYITDDTIMILVADNVYTTTTGYTSAAGVSSLTRLNIDGLSVRWEVCHINKYLSDQVQNVLWFTLVEPQPFVLDASDFNSKLGTQATSGFQKMLFDPDVDASHTNYFTQGTGVKIVHINASNTNLIGYHSAIENGSLAYLDTVRASYLDSLGYVFVQNSANEYLYVDTTYYHETLPGATKGTRFLNFNWGNLPDTFLTSNTNLKWQDSVMILQHAFRFLFDPASNNIEVNVYKATYWPEDYVSEGLIKDSTRYWADSAVQRMYTYDADTATLELYDDKGLPLAHSWSDTMAARLRTGLVDDWHIRASNGGGYVPEPWRYHQRLAVSVQDLTGEKKIMTLTQESSRAQLDVYTPCDDGIGTDKTTVPMGLYLIRNAKGEYLRVPLYSATDSCEWWELEADEHPELMPSFQWIVEKRYENNDIAPVTIVNREFPWLKFQNIQLSKTPAPFAFRNSAKFRWNKINVNGNAVDLSKDDGKASFIRIDDPAILNDEKLGYTWINPDTAMINLYAFNYYSKIDPTRYISWKGDLHNYPNTDTTIYTDGNTHFSTMYFRLDSIHSADEYGGLRNYGYDVDGNSKVKDLGIAQLKRQAYWLGYEDPLKYYCINNFYIQNGEGKKYVLAQRGAFRDIIGRPVFYLRNTYHRKNVENALEPYFAMVQTLDTLSPRNPNFHSLAASLKEYLKREYGPTLAEIVMNTLTSIDPADQDYFNPSLFVAAFDDQTSYLKTTLRAEVQERISTFRLQKDDDPLYRRFNRADLEGEGDGDGQDAPKTVHFHHYNNSHYRLFENTGAIQPQYWNSQSAGYGQRHYLGEVVTTQNPQVNTNIYVDTAYVNRGTGYIKPQYMLVVRPEKVEPADVCDPVTGEPLPGIGESYLRGYYLINAYDSAHVDGKLDTRYLWNTQWERFIFVDAVHARDHLYIIEGLPSDVMAKILYSDNKSINLDKLADEAAAGRVKAIFLGNNLHKDCVFSFRLVERDANDFIIESESTDRTDLPMIKPCEGGWLKIQNNVPVISRAALSGNIKAMGEAQVFNVTAGDKAKATGNDAVEVSKITVVGDAGTVTILGAAGKGVVITNLLGQTVTNTVLASDNATLAAPKGIVIVSVDGEDTVKVLVK